jgi:REP element-mobilizing transposase RayT
VGYRTANKTVYSAKYHLIRCPSTAGGCWSGRVDARLEEIVAGVAREVGAEVVEIVRYVEDQKRAV